MSRAWAFVKRQDTTIGRLTTVGRYGDKGITAALNKTFAPADLPFQVFCLHYRAVNLAKHGKDRIHVFHTLIEVKRMARIAEMKNSSAFNELGAAA